MKHIAGEHAVDRERVEALRRGDEAAFGALVEEFQPLLRRVVRHYVDSPSVAEEVIQDTWLGVIRGIFAFQCRSSLKTWIFRILVNRAKTRAVREKRLVPFADLGVDDPERPDHDAAPPNLRDDLPHDPGPSPEQVVLGEEVQRRLVAAVEELPSNLRLVLTLRDIEGWSSEETCNVLGIRETNQRVLLHRARERVRTKLAPYLGRGRGAR